MELAKELCCHFRRGNFAAPLPSWLLQGPKLEEPIISTIWWTRHAPVVFRIWPSIFLQNLNWGTNLVETNH